MASREPSANQARDPAGDALRAWAIMGVVVIHGLDLTLNASTFAWVSRYFRWAVPAFIVLSAYYTTLASSRQQRSPLLPWLKARYIKLLPPFVFFSVFYLLMFADLPNLTAKKLLTTHMAGYGWAGQYFFIVLFQLLPVIWFLAGRRIRPAAVAASMALGLVLYGWAPRGFEGSLLLRQWGHRLFVYWLPYCVWGVFLAQNKAYWMARVQALPAWLKTMLTLGLPMLMAVTPGPSGPNSPYVLPVVLMVSSVYVPVCLGAFRTGAGPLGAYLGQHAMAVFCLNPMFIALCRAHWPEHGLWRADVWASSLSVQVLGSALLLLGIASACLLTGAILKRLGLGGLLP